MIPKRIENAAAHATILKREIADRTVELDACKDEIREWAGKLKEEDPGLTSLEIPTIEGTCTVVFPELKAEFIKGVPPQGILSALTPAVAKHVAFLDYKVAIAKEFSEWWKGDSFRVDERKTISKYIQFVQPTARVEPAK